MFAWDRGERSMIIGENVCVCYCTAFLLLCNTWQRRKLSRDKQYNDRTLYLSIHGISHCWWRGEVIAHIYLREKDFIITLGSWRDINLLSYIRDTPWAMERVTTRAKLALARRSNSAPGYKGGYAPFECASHDETRKYVTDGAKLV